MNPAVLMFMMNNKGPTLGDLMGDPNDPDDFGFYAVMVTLTILGLGAIFIYFHYGLTHHG